MIIALDADIYNFQECYVTSSSQLRNLFNSIAPIGGNGWYTHKGRNQIIVSRYELSMQSTNVPNGTRGIAMALVDLPDAHFSNDMFILNNHYPCCDNEAQRVEESRAIADWIQDAITTGGNFDLVAGTAISVLGDLNTVRGPQPLNILLNGEGLSPDWDGTSITAAPLFHNETIPENWTWRNDESQFDPGVLDYIIHTDSVLELQRGFILNPSYMTNAELAATGLQATDFMLDKDRPQDNVYDHMPLVVDFVSADPDVFNPDLLAVSNGTYSGGNVGDLGISDNIDYSVQRSDTDVQSRVVIEFKGVSTETNLTDFDFHVEASVFARTDVVQSIDFFNYETSTFEEVDSRLASRFADSGTTVSASGDVSRFLEPGTGCVISRLRFQSPVARQRFAANIDFIEWSLN